MSVQYTIIDDATHTEIPSDVDHWEVTVQTRTDAGCVTWHTMHIRNPMHIVVCLHKHKADMVTFEARRREAHWYRNPA